MKLAAASAATLKALLVPVSAPALLVTVMVKLPVFVIVTARPASTPALKLGVVPPPALRVPVALISAVPVKSGVVLP